MIRAQPHAQQFRNPVHCADMSVDRLVYVCDRVNDRLQVFTPDGKFVKEMYYQVKTKTDGSVWDIAFSKDPQQKYIFMADGVNEQVRMIDRQSLQASSPPSATAAVSPASSMACTASPSTHEGNIYTTETYEGKRLQRFMPKGMAPVTKMDQGVPWPAQ